MQVSGKPQATGDLIDEVGNSLSIVSKIIILPESRQFEGTNIEKLDWAELS